MRVASPHELLDPKRSELGRAGSGGPLVAIRLHVLTRKTLGGLETDLDGRVLGADGSAVARGVRGGRGGRASVAAACTATEPWRARSWAAACSPAESPAGLWQRVFDETGCEAVNSFAGISESFLRTDPRM